MIAYADASFLASLYLVDRNSPHAVRALRARSATVVISEFGLLETVSAFYQRCFRNQLDKNAADSLAQNLHKDVDSDFWLLRAIPEGAYIRARALTGQWTGKLGTRAGDPLHVATCIELKADVLFTFDKRQQNLAKSCSMKCLP